MAMATEYYVLLGQAGFDGQRINLTDFDLIVDYLHLYQHQMINKFYVIDSNALYVESNSHSGNVALQAENQNRPITYLFSSDIEKPYTQAIKDAIAIYAQFYLFKKINGLNATEYPGVEKLKEIIKAEGVNAITGAKIESKKVNKAMLKLCAYFRKDSAFSELNGGDFDMHINSLKKADEIVEGIKHSLKGQQYTSMHKPLFR